MAFSTVIACLDGSGDLGDHDVVSMGCVAGFAERFNDDFAQEWAMLLRRYGIKVLSAKTSLNHERPLSVRNPCLGIEARTEALLTFVKCIRGHLQNIIALATDVRAFKKLGHPFFQRYGSDPAFMTFARIAMRVTEFTPDGSKVSLVCDDDEKTAWRFYRLYKRAKKILPDCRKKLGQIAFADDRYVFGLQASDLVASLVRLEASKEIAGIEYDYSPLYQQLVANPEKHERWLYNIAIGVADMDKMRSFADNLGREIEDARRQDFEEQRIRELRPNNATVNPGSALRDQGQVGRGKSGKKKKA